MSTQEKFKAFSKISDKVMCILFILGLLGCGWLAYQTYKNGYQEWTIALGPLLVVVGFFVYVWQHLRLSIFKKGNEK